MKKETTYQKYRRRNKEMSSIISVDVQKFFSNTSLEERAKRSIYLNKCIALYRQKTG